MTGSDSVQSSAKEPHSRETRICSAKEALALIKPGNRVFIGTGCAAPVGLVEAFESLSMPPDDIACLHLMTCGLPWAENGESNYRHRTYFVGTDSEALVRQGRGEYVPLSSAEFVRLVENGRIRIDVALIRCTPPDTFGYVNLGVSVDVLPTVIRHARHVIAEVNPAMPRTMGETSVDLDSIDRLVIDERPMTEFSYRSGGDVAERIAHYVAEIIEDGATLQIGPGPIPAETLRFLGGRRDLGIHSDWITEEVVDLIQSGVLTGRAKTLHRDRVVASGCLGTHRLQNFVDGNPMFDFKPVNYVASIDVIARHRRMVSLTEAQAIDLTGQVCIDQFHGEIRGGVGCQPEFMRGASLAEGGKPIICLPSTTDDGKESRIRPLLLAGEGVTIPRTDAHYIVTEWGIAYLFGKSVRERAIELIEIAHPDFRASLLEEARRLGYVHPEQKLASTRAYPIEEERTLQLKSGRTVMIRPARAADVTAMKDIFYRMSQDDVYLRFFRRLSSLSFQEAQRLCNVDFETDVAFVATTGTREDERIVGTGCYFLNPSTNIAEVAYMVMPDWQGTGLGSALQDKLTDFARRRGVRGFLAQILTENVRMLGLAKRAGQNIEIRREDDCFEVTTLFE
jgi:acyl-CoA hydrolase/GNAT superfamily N-acetyltransferase